MKERRREPRMLCADLIEVRWTDRHGRAKSVMANLEDISASGACLQVETPVPEQALVRFDIPQAQLEGRVRYCTWRDTGYFLGVQFEPGCRWEQRRFQPKHLFDPRRLLEEE
jgi:hypothetical protein